MIEEQKRYFAVISVLLALAALSYLPFVYQGTLGEPDSFRMALGIIDSIETYGLFRGPALYNLRISYGYYALLYLFVPLFRANLGLLIHFMNYLNAMSAILMVIPLFLVARRYWGINTAILANILLIFVPSWWYISLYAHPMMQAMLFVFIGLALIGFRSNLASKSASWKLVILDILIVLAFYVSLTFRLDAVLMFPLITACLFLEGYPFKKIVLLSILYSLPALIIFSVIQSTFPDMESPETFQRLSVTHNFDRLVSNLHRGLFIGILAGHPLYLLAFCISCIYLASNRNYLGIFFILPVFILNFLFWLPNPSPARHFVYIAPVLAVGIAIWLSAIPWGITALTKYSRVLMPIPAVILFVIISFISSELLYAAIRTNYLRRFAPERSASNYSIRAPIRSIFINKYYSEQAFHRAARFGQDLLQLEPKDKQVFVLAEGLPVTLQMQLSSGGLPRKIQKVNSAADREDPDRGILYFVRSKNNDFVLAKDGGELMELLRAAGAPEEYCFVVDPYNSSYATFDTTLQNKCK